MRISWLGKTSDRVANSYGLVVVLLMVVYIASVATSGGVGNAAVTLLQLVTLWLIFTASESPAAQRIAGAACLIVAALIVGGSLVGHVLQFDETMIAIVSVISAVVYVIAPLFILRHLVQRKFVDVQTLLGAISVYLMFGIAFAFTYRSISLLQSGAFFGEDGNGTTAQFLFFSFITLTTTGYGNLVPSANPGQSLAVLEAIVGQLFLVIAVAKIVNAWSAKP